MTGGASTGGTLCNSNKSQFDSTPGKSSVSSSSFKPAKSTSADVIRRVPVEPSSSDSLTLPCARTVLKMSSKKVIEFFYDVVSPYSWLGFELMCRYRNVWNVEVKLRPAFLGGVMHGSGNKPPGVVPNKFLYMTKDLQRLSKYFEVPLCPPSDPFEAMFEKGSLSAMRFVAAVQQREKDGDKQVEQVSRELWRRIWSQDKDITEPASLSEAAREAGLSADEIEAVLELSKSKEIKDKLKSSTQDALGYGSFGFPMMVCHIDGKPEVFFGSDRFELMAHCLGEKWLGPVPHKSAAKL